MCHFNVTNNNQPLALDHFENFTYKAEPRISINLRGNFITASAAVTVESFSLVFVAFLDENGRSFIIGVSSVFYRKPSNC